MLENTNRLSASNVDEENDIENIKTRLHSEGKPIFSWIKNSCNNDNTITSKPNIILSSDQVNKKTTDDNKENSKQLELKGVQSLRHLWNSRITKAAKALSPAKSYSCLLQSDKSPPIITRALSVHNIIETLETPTSVRSTKDNFYKYKTAATVEKNQCKSASPASTTPTHSLSSRLSSNFLMVVSTQGGEKIHWMRRDDIMLPKKEEPLLLQQETDTKMNTMKAPHMAEVTFSTLQVPSLQALIECDNKSSKYNQSVSKAKDAISSHCSLNSLRSSETTNRKNANSNRKYSFKTQVKSYHSPRKMPNHNSSNKVAKLTQQFNERIKKDKKVLDEVRRNNGILISRSGHVYKVIDNSDTTTTSPPTVLPNCVQETLCSPKKNISTVQRAIKSFESRTNEKPNIPLKSAQVLRKKKELVSRKEIKNELKSVVLKEIDEETKFFDENVLLGSKRLENDFSLRVNNVVELLENKNRTQIKTDRTSNNIAPSCEVKKDTGLEKKTKHSKIYDKLWFRGVFRKTDSQGNTKENPVVLKKSPDKCSTKVEDAAEDLPKILQPSGNISCIAFKNKSEKIESNLPYSSEEPSMEIEDLQGLTTDSVEKNSLKPQQDSSDSSAEVKLLTALEEVNNKIEALAARSIGEEESHLNDSFLDQNDIKAQSEEIPVEAINTHLVNFAEMRAISSDTNVVMEKVNKEVNDNESKNSSNEDGNYEFIASEGKMMAVPDFTRTVHPQKSCFLFCSTRKTIQNHELKENYESCENFEHINGNFKPYQCPDYGYEICETPTEAVAPPRPKKESTETQRNTTDKLPELPEPKRIIPKKLFNTVVPRTDMSSRASDSGSINDEDSIYDTIKGPHCYESLKCSTEKDFKCADTISLTSNAYESINNYIRRPMLCNAESTSTISSHHKTNSLYEVSLVNGIIAGGGGQKYSHSYITSSENSDDWVDISDSEANAYDQLERHQFIVVREKTKCHRSPNWSKRVRDKRLHQTISDDVCSKNDRSNTVKMDAPDTGTIKTIPRQRKARAVGEVYITSPSSSIYLNSKFHENIEINEPIYQNTEIEQLNRKISRQRDKFSAVRMELNLATKTQTTLVTFVDDVEHYYEPLFPLSNQNISKSNDNTTKLDRPDSLPFNQNNQFSTDDYDSFDTDDDVYEDDKSVKKIGSGVDIRNARLPNPPPSKSQVYEFVKKFKNFITIKKSPNDTNKNIADSVQAKMYENTQFQVEGNEYQSTIKPTRRAPDKPKIKKTLGRPITDHSIDDNVYENTYFHPNLISTSQPFLENGSNLSASEKSLISTSDITNRSKCKTGKSFKSRLKSLGATSFDSKQMSSPSLARSTFYVSETSEKDSGIFEKSSSGDQASDTLQAKKADQQPIAALRKNKREATTLNAYRRRTTIGLRPNDAPPPPPVVLEDGKISKQRSSTTSWYAECGVFKIQNNSNANDVISDKQTLDLNKSTTNTSWYAEAGLYQTSGVSVASSSGSSGVSTGNEGGIGDNIGHHMFLNEPLYQIYNAEKLESMSRDMEDHESTDGYEEIGDNRQNPGSERPKRTRPSALQLVGPKSSPSRTLWSEIPEVITSEILPTLTSRERSLQEAKFEVITSEASYLKSLNLLRSHFMNNQAFHDTSILSSRDRRALFSFIAPVHECSEKLLRELETCWQENIMLLGLSKSLYTCAEKHFQVYVAYCEHQGKMDRALRRLKEAKGSFCQKLDQLESDTICCGLTLHSFLMLPMQRVTRLPLLIDAVFSKVHPNDDEYDNWKLTLAMLNKIVVQCNEAANRCEQTYEIERISRQLEFPVHIRPLAIAPVGVAATGAKPRFLVKKGELVHLVWRGDDAKLTFGKKFTKSNIYAFLFSDLMVLTKQKGEQFTVFDYCPRNMLTISAGDSIPQLPTKDSNQTGKNLILMTLLENFEGKTVEIILSCPSVSEMERWILATKPPEAETPGEKLYEQWDCPQVITTHEFVATEPDLLSLEVGDVVNVSRKLPDGWFNGERIRDGATGWFPGSFTEEVNSAHVRARNLKQRYRLLTFTATYLELQKRK